MYTFLFIFFLILGVLGIVFSTLLVLALLFGNRLPSEYSGSVTATIDRPIEDVWKSIKDVVSNPISARMCLSVTEEVDEDGTRFWYENISSGKIRVISVSEAEMESWVRRSIDASADMQSLCKVEVRDVGDVCQIKANNQITLGTGSFFGPLLRSMLYFFGLTRIGMKKYVAQIAGSLETSADFSDA
jgi:hypothetical protein